MYNYFSGSVVSVEGNLIVLDCNGIGYEIFATNACVQNAVLDQTLKIFVWLCVREDEMSLFGFADERERNMFFNLTSISGIGSKTAITLLSAMTTNDLAHAIINQDSKAFGKVKGVGKKTAERILLELKDKFKGQVAENPKQQSTKIDEETFSEAQYALFALGFRTNEVADMLSKIENIEKMTAEQIVALALRNKR